MNELLQQSRNLKEEADRLLSEKGLLQILQQFGTPLLSGSYALNLMTWRDLDIYLQANELNEADFFNLGGKLCTALRPLKMHYRNERLALTPGLPEGLYWGIYLGNERKGDWKIDIWCINEAESKRLLQYANQLKAQLHEAAVESILSIKHACWQDPGYRRAYGSTDIYEAVLHHQVCDHEGFQQYLSRKG